MNFKALKRKIELAEEAVVESFTKKGLGNCVIQFQGRPRRWRIDVALSAERRLRGEGATLLAAWKAVAESAHEVAAIEKG
jgi:hypothetical protein